HSIDLAAPGVNILSTLPSDSYGSLSGTSMSTPYVTGVIALVRTIHPNWTYQQVIAQVLNTVDPLPSLQGKTLTGGRVAVAAARRRPAHRTSSARSTSSARRRSAPSALPLTG